MVHFRRPVVSDKEIRVVRLGKEIVGIRNKYSLYVVSLLGHGKTINYL